MIHCFNRAGGIRSYLRFFYAPKMLFVFFRIQLNFFSFSNCKYLLNLTDHGLHKKPKFNSSCAFFAPSEWF